MGRAGPRGWSVLNRRYGALKGTGASTNADPLWSGSSAVAAGGGQGNMQGIMALVRVRRWRLSEDLVTGRGPMLGARFADRLLVDISDLLG